MVYEATGSGLKESIVLESAPQPNAGGDERDDEQEGEQGRAGVSFAYELTTSPGVVAELADHGMVVLRDTADPKAGPAGDGVVFSIPLGSMVDSASPEPAFSDAVTYDLTSDKQAGVCQVNGVTGPWLDTPALRLAESRGRERDPRACGAR